MQLLSPIYRELQVEKIEIEDASLVDDEAIRSIGAAFELLEDTIKEGLSKGATLKAYVTIEDRKFIIYRSDNKVKIVEV
ncbi:MAG: hypothetical protein ACP6IS_02440 [Candidatus Asgardarchaeia archaeon]